ncbi:4Fe-4S ferredoxin [Sulfolobus acidocaldarius SUSAZ]|nr:4Fe-4S ferredoxin [Sulfolobus acidocaldarius SUSAZ]
MDLLPIFVIIASVMTAVSIYLIYLVKKGINGIGFLLVLYLSGSMLIMFISLSIALSNTRLTTEILALAVNTAYMIVGLLSILLLGASRRKMESRKWYTVILFSFLMTISEALMGESFYSILTKSIGNPLIGTENYWFYAVMLAEMAFTLIYSFNGLTRQIRNYLLITLPIMVVSPVILPTFSIWLSSLLMIVATIIIYDTLYRNRLKKTQETFTSLELMLIFTLMMAGIFTYYMTSSWYLYDVSMILGMTWFIYRAIQGPSSIKGNYLRDSRWTFAFILITFIMEWFMGAVLDFASGYFSPGVEGFISSLSLGFVNPLSYFGAGALFDFLSVFGSVTGSVWFLIMMGLEMGTLAIFRIKEVRLRENKIRLALMVSAFAIYAVYIPSFSPLASKIPYIPYMWSMGLGTLGPVSTDYLLSGIVGTYVLSAVLSFLFGSRQICSVTCTAPTMYQGTFYNSLKVYNRTSSLARKTLSSKLRPWYKVIAITIWSSLLAFAVISYFDQKGILNITIFGNDPTMFLYSFYFNFLWYVVFISIPFSGNYACVTQGWCSWGTFNQFFGGLGLFRLKVKDPELCVKCETKACSYACPVGNTDLPGNFIKRGEFKSSRCIGVGDCAEACPYDNIVFYDVRSWLKEKIKGNKI